MVDTLSITFTGVYRSSVSPTPSRPKELSPHAHRVPSVFTAYVVQLSEMTFFTVAFVGVGSGTGSEPYWM